MKPYQNCAYVNTAWAPMLATVDLSTFQQLWDVKLPWVEDPNFRRGGWSGVMRCQLNAKDIASTVYIKRQQNHIYRPTFRPKRGLPTFYREARNLLYLQMHGIPVVTPVFFDMRKDGKDQQAVLVTQALIGYRSLEELMVFWREHGFPNENTSKAIIASVAVTIRKIHDLGYRHGAFKPKHIFIRYDEANETADVRLLDFEVSRRVRYKRRRILPDLTHLYFPYRKLLPARYYLHFLKSYLRVDNATAKDFKLVKDLRDFKNRKHLVSRLRNALFRRHKVQRNKVSA